MKCRAGLVLHSMYLLQ